MATRTSRSRPVRKFSRGSSRAVPQRSSSSRSANASSSRRASAGAITASPAATARIPASNSSGRMSLSRKPLAPARSAANAYRSTSNVVSTRIRERPPAATMRGVASIPSTPGMWMSISTTSGRSSVIRRTASAPFAASPTISVSGVLSSSMRNPKRCSGWASTKSTEIMNGCLSGSKGRSGRRPARAGADRSARPGGSSAAAGFVTPHPWQRTPAIRRFTMSGTSIFGGNVRRTPRSAVALLTLTPTLAADLPPHRRMQPIRRSSTWVWPLDSGSTRPWSSLRPSPRALTSNGSCCTSTTSPSPATTQRRGR
jgi:hypothetical protein